MRRSLLLLSPLIALMLTVNALAETNQPMTFVWDVIKNKNFFPERDDSATLGVAEDLRPPDLRIEAFKNGNEMGNTLGFAFSGGGTRAATATLGQFRALHHLNWLSRAQYVSTVSGGTWGSLAYTFLPLNNAGCQGNAGGAMDFDDTTFLGAYTPPASLEWSQIDKKGKKAPWRGPSQRHAWWPRRYFTWPPSGATKLIARPSATSF